ncbi:alkaline phosphatase D [Klebsormidium nitens]|uniref:Alkaline phosphatase D n=1 Tax=Klebsormidium nitens TaxID=105231 RepID=A0A0U9HT05_KLENI|nr:alkaline phosphatase D [Klebsormidium nitens]|eukprot:GAQ83664.1 alkaline phosphatase D [Klebsormidium nitens]
MAASQLVKLFLTIVLALYFNHASATLDFIKSSQLPNLDTEPLTRIAFGSCINQTIQQPIWNAINAYHPQLWIWLGDNIYADTKRNMVLLGPKRNVGPWRPSPRFVPVSNEVMAKQYALQNAQPGYVQLKQRTHVVGTWDDHDYGLNDAGKEFEGKADSMRLMLDFIGEPKDSPRRKQDGVYAAYTYGPPGRRVKVFLLDTRYNRDAKWSDGDVLGEAQWQWLEHELETSDAQIHIIGSSVQVVTHLSELVQPFFHTEAWGHYPTARKRLYDTINRSQKGGVILLSGDVHFGEISREDCAIGYRLHDLTSSGLTQGVQKSVKAPTRWLMKLAAVFVPRIRRIVGPYSNRNFATISIDWEADPVEIELQIRDEDGDRVHKPVRLRLSSLQPGANGLPLGEVRTGCLTEENLVWHAKYRLAIVFIGVPVLVLSYIGWYLFRRSRRPWELSIKKVD